MVSSTVVVVDHGKNKKAEANMVDTSAGKKVLLERKIDRITALQDGIGKNISRARERVARKAIVPFVVSRTLRFVTHTPFFLTFNFSDRYDVCWTA
jgi:hypothetical protein